MNMPITEEDPTNILLKLVSCSESLVSWSKVKSTRDLVNRVTEIEVEYMYCSIIYN